MTIRPAASRDTLVTLQQAIRDTLANNACANEKLQTSPRLALEELCRLIRGLQRAGARSVRYHAASRTGGEQQVAPSKAVGKMNLDPGSYLLEGASATTF